MSPSTDNRRTFSARELAFLIGVPAAWAILLAFHPLGDDGFYPVIDGNETAWLAVHLGMGIFVPLFAGVLYLLLRGVPESSPSRSTRCPRAGGRWAQTSSSRTLRAGSS